jgi:putative endonuclease
MNSTERGRRAEAAAAVYLEMRGYKIIERNWRRPRAEIDILARKADTMYFVEVKYRATDHQGGGMDAITATKLRQMQRAAELWVEEEKWRQPYQLAAIDIAGDSFAVMSFIDNVY